MANPGASFNRDYLYSPGVVFVVNQQEYDGKYILTSLDFLLTTAGLYNRGFRYRIEIEAWCKCFICTSQN